MINLNIATKYEVRFTTDFKKNFKKIIKQGKDVKKLMVLVNKLANKEPLEAKYKDHSLRDDKQFKNCRDCHIEPDWILIYKYSEGDLILLLVNTGSHSEILDK